MLFHVLKRVFFVSDAADDKLERFLHRNIDIHIESENISALRERQDTQHNETQYSDIQYNATQHNGFFATLSITILP
jgi:hypothetical protein